MVEFVQKPRYTAQDLVRIVALLRQPEGGCPWDKAQTHASIRRNFLEETYEVLDAIDRDDPHAMCEELGDVLMQVVFHAQIESEAGRFTMEDVVDGEVRKLLFRHPHVFGSAAPEKDAESVLVSWDAIKRREKHQRTTAQAMDSVARSLPALWRAEKIQTKAARAGFEWPNAQAALDKLAEELAELQQAVAEDSNIEEELGDLLFAAVKVARFFHIDAEEALAGTCEKFIRRFSGVEAAVTAQGRTMHDLDVAQLMALWNREKHPEQREKKTREGKHQ